MIKIVQAATPAQVEEARTLFREYEKWLDVDLCFQGFEEELAQLPGKYAKPNGRLLLAKVEKEFAGCIALRKINDGVCEMKRLFVRKDFRGLGLGKILIEKLINEARQISYHKMRLDTLPVKMPQAVKLYKTFGFYEISPYYKNPHDETLFLELNLKELSKF